MPRRRPILRASTSRRFLASLEPAHAIAARHTVGLVDALTRAETAGKRIDDGLPESLEEVDRSLRPSLFQAQGCRQRRGRHRTADRYRRRARPHGLAAIRSTLDGNEQYDDDRRGDRAVAPHRRGAAAARLKSSILLHRAADRARPRAGRTGARSSRTKFRSRSTSPTPTSSVFPRARALGYRGISSKSCKGFYRALINARASRNGTPRKAPHAISCRPRT